MAEVVSNAAASNKSCNQTLLQWKVLAGSVANRDNHKKSQLQRSCNCMQ